MTKSAFQRFWAKNYPNSLPVSHLLKHAYPTRWLRIHSLPAAKRYADTNEEWVTLLDRQNTIINDLVPENAIIQVVINYIREDNILFKKYTFENIGVVVDKINETVYQSFNFKINWQNGTANDILKAIADDEIKGFFITKNQIIAPYDGGLDLIFKDESTRNIFREKYKNWLSERADGL